MILLISLTLTKNKLKNNSHHLDFNSYNSEPNSYQWTAQLMQGS